MSEVILVALIAVVLVGLTVALARMPHWFVRSLYRHKLWRLRDQVADEVLGGTLPRHPSVRALMDEIEADVRKTSRVTYIDLIIVRRLRRRLSSAASEQLRQSITAPSPKGLPQEAQVRLNCFKEEQAKIISEAILLGSWCGLLALCYFVPATFVDAWKDHRRIAAARAWKSAAEAVSRTRMGRSTVDAVRERSPQVSVGV